MAVRRLLVGGIGSFALALTAVVAAAEPTSVDRPAAVSEPAVRLLNAAQVAPTLPPPPRPTVPITTTSVPGRCHPSYPTVCIPPPPPDLDCPEVPFTDFLVVGNDPHGFDRDNDGIGCES